MTNAITKKEYEQIKNDRSYTVVSFEKDTGKRRSSYSGLWITKAVEEYNRNILNGFDSLILHDFKESRIILDLPRSEQTMELYKKKYIEEKNKLQCEKCYEKHYCKEYNPFEKEHECKKYKPIGAVFKYP